MNVLLVVHEDAAVGQALAADLRVRFGGSYAVRAAGDPAEALAVARGAAVALTIASPALLDVLDEVHALHPGARRVLLISRGEWSTAHPAIQAMALGRIDSYLFNPWRPAERLLYLPVGEFLADWESARPAERVALTIVGGRSDPRSSALRSRCARGALPFTFLLADSPAGQQVLADAGLDGSVLPVVAFFTGQVMADPSDAELADWLGFSTSPSADAYDVAVIGAGPAGLTAGMYAASEGLRTLILDGELPGGQASTSSLIRNYLGFPRGLTGADLANRALEQAWLFGADVVAAQQVTALDVRGDDRVIRLASGVSATASAVVVASGVSWRRLGIPELEALRGAGVFYGAAGGEAQVVADQDVLVVGGGNSAGQAAVHLAKSARTVTVVIRGASLVSSMSDYLIRILDATPNIAVRTRTRITGGRGTGGQTTGGRLAAVVLATEGAGTQELEVPAMFVMIGAEPRTDWLGDAVARDAHGYVLTGHDLLTEGKPPAGWPLDRPPLLLETSVPGVFAAGDVRHRSVKRVASAVGEGATAIQLVHAYLSERP